MWQAAAEAGLARDGGAGQLTDELVGQVAEAVRPVRPGGHGRAWDQLEACQEQIAGQVKAGLSVVKIGVLLERQGVVVPYRTLHRFCVERCGFGKTAATVRVADGEPGAECQIDFGYLGLLADPVTRAAAEGARADLHRVLFAAHVRVAELHPDPGRVRSPGARRRGRSSAGCSRSWSPTTPRAIVADADAVNPRFTAGWLDYAQHCGFATDAARVRSPKDKPRVERAVQYVRGNFFAGEAFTGLADAQARAEAWCRDTAGMRIHGTIAARPAEVFAEHEAGRAAAAVRCPMTCRCSPG